MTNIQTDRRDAGEDQGTLIVFWVGRGLNGMGMGIAWERNGIAV